MTKVIYMNFIFLKKNYPAKIYIYISIYIHIDIIIFVQTIITIFKTST